MSRFYIPKYTPTPIRSESLIALSSTLEFCRSRDEEVRVLACPLLYSEIVHHKNISVDFNINAETHQRQGDVITFEGVKLRLAVSPPFEWLVERENDILFTLGGTLFSCGHPKNSTDICDHMRNTFYCVSGPIPEGILQIRNDLLGWIMASGMVSFGICRNNVDPQYPREALEFEKWKREITEAYNEQPLRYCKIKF